MWNGISRIIYVATTVFASIGTILTSSFTYLCISHGTYCGGSVAAPGSDQTIRENREQLSSILATDSGRDAFAGYSISVESGFFWGERIVVSAKLADAKSIVVDTIDYGGAEYDVSYDNKRGVAALAITGAYAKRPRSSAYLYFSGRNFERRAFHLECEYSHEMNKVSIFNLSYVSDKRRFMFDVMSTCAPVSVNGASKILEHKTGERGTTVEIDLTETLHVSKVSTWVDMMRRDQAAERERKAAHALDECVKKISSESVSIDGGYVGCSASNSTVAGGRQELVVLEKRDGGVSESARLTGIETWVQDHGARGLIAASKEIMPGGAFSPPTHSYTFRVFNRSLGGGRSFEIKGHCQRLDMEPRGFAADGRSLRLDATTDCQDVYIDGAKHETGYKIGQGAQMTRKLYVLSIDEKFLAISFLAE